MNNYYRYFYFGVIFIFSTNFIYWMYGDDEKSKWPGSLPVVDYYINPNINDVASPYDDEQQIQAIRNAANTWFLEGQSNFKFRYSGDTINYKFQTGHSWNDWEKFCEELRSLQNTIFSAPPDLDGSGEIGNAWVRECDGEIVHFDIKLNSNQTWSSIGIDHNQYDIQSVATHELGHALGLDHCVKSECTQEEESRGTNPHVRATMRTYYWPIIPRTLHPDDKKGIRRIYGKKIYFVQGAIHGLSHLFPQTVVLELFINGESFDTLSLTDGQFAFTKNVPNHSNYEIKIKTQPDRVYCRVVDGIGTINDANGSGRVECEPSPYKVKGTTQGLGAEPIVLKLLVNGIKFDTKTVTGGQFEFSKRVPDGVDYVIKIKTQPDNVFCSVIGGSGIINGADGSGLIDCEPSLYQVWGDIEAITPWGLELELFINGQRFDETDLINHRFAFYKKVPDGVDWEIKIKTQADEGSEFCEPAIGVGTISGENGIGLVVCEPSYPVIGEIQNLPVGEVLLELIVNGESYDTTNMLNHRFGFRKKLPNSKNYEVKIKSQPSDYNCTLTDGLGTIHGDTGYGGLLNCEEVTPNFSIIGIAEGEPFFGPIELELLVDSISYDFKIINNKGTFKFSKKVPDGSNFYVNVIAKPASLNCYIDWDFTPLVWRTINGESEEIVLACESL